MAGAGGAGSGCQPLTPHMPGTHVSTGHPESIHAPVRAHIHTQLGAHLQTHVTPRSNHSHTRPTRSRQLIHAHMEMEKGRSRQGRAELGKGQLSPGRVAEADPGVQPPNAEAPARPSGLAPGAWSTGIAKRTVATYGVSAYYVLGPVLRPLGVLAHCLFLTPTCEKGSY